MQTVEESQKIIPVILSGGSGTRLWPISRKSFPKQFWPLLTDRSMLAETALRASTAEFAPPIVVTNQEHRFVVAEQLRNAGIENPRLVLEPAGRNSAPAIAAAALLAAETTPQAVLWIMAADAAIGDPAALQAAVIRAAAAARAGHVVTFGMHPTTAETGYGYIRQGNPMPGLDGTFHLDRFIEKPDAATAAKLVEAGGHFWNSGMFMFRADVLIDEMDRLAPEIMVAVRAALQTRSTDLDFIRLGSPHFEAAPDISIDYALAEKTDKAVVVPAAIGWSDVGSWTALAEIAPKDANSNFALGEVVLENSTNSYARSDGIVTALLGVQDLIVVTTQDAVLVAHKQEAQNVKRVVDRLKAQKRPEADAHNRTYRPWGFYESLIKGDRFQVKRIVVWP
ncbi:MAG: mannose-1-phosphate guanylyltransferase/mannose-6-phosphate isomerase, partial [Rhodospirillales bacterium 20-64-7]